MRAALLPDRGVVKVAGEDARTFLNGLLTSDIARVDPLLQRIRQQFVREALITHRPRETQHRGGSDRCEAHIGRRGIRAAVIHRMANLDAGRKTV